MSASTYATINPFTEQLVKTYTPHTPEQVERMLAAADGAYRSDWSRGPIEPRLAVLARLSELLIDHADELAEAMATEMGKLVAQGHDEVKLCAGIAKYYAERGRELLQPVPYKSDAGDAWVQHQPIGVLVAIEPWNFPFYQLIRVVAPAMAVGNPVMLKHAENVPHCAELFEKLVREAGAPEGVYANLFVSNDQISDLIGDDRVQGVALTGSERAGSAVAARASSQLKKATLELGGSDAFIVLDDADIATAAKVGAMARLANAGQVCTAAKRFILHAAIADRFTEAFSAAMQGVTLGDPLDAATTLGPLCTKEALDRLDKQVNDAVTNGAGVLFGGRRADRQGYFYEPTILTGLKPENPAYYEEFFGPVAQVYVAQSDDEIVTLANDSRFGLGGSIFAGDIERAKALASRIETGMVYINTATGTMPELPFGGVKRSGFGRELGDLGIMEFVNKKLVVVAG
ncbi:NAD-dependent succinate-semialdehyde dehydrogenase [Sphingomonas sp.]|uniref:NAD-dependent succinate-semialdehyde dehydrogenase n=1 Tax=Sphingomonas sp. TaxID=28214 RepID=UPI0035BBD9AB